MRARNQVFSPLLRFFFLTFLSHRFTTFSQPGFTRTLHRLFVLFLRGPTPVYPPGLGAFPGRARRFHALLSASSHFLTFIRSYLRSALLLLVITNMHIMHGVA